jgi:cyclopropane fatty-acyl-phospholipid synthase-like methyltransferase
MEHLFPRSSRYDPAWIAENWMGPNALWLMESLCTRLALEPGMRVMDLGCGRAMTSVFLAQEFDVQVWATDLWIRPEENWKRIREAGLEDRVFPIYAEAHALPFAHEFFDAIVSVDAYHYFGTADTYVEYVTQFLVPGGQLGIVSPGFKRELDGDVPDHLHEQYHHGQWHTFHTAQWWQRHWEKTGALEVTSAEAIPEAWDIWRASAEDPGMGPDTEAIETDGGALLTFSRVVGRKPG